MCGCQVLNKTLLNCLLFLFYLLCFLGLAGRRQEWCVLVGQWALRAAGRNGNQPYRTHSRTISVANTTGSNVVSPDTFVLITTSFSLSVSFRCLWCFVNKVVCGQNCSFLIQSNGVVTAVGEGQYGRLGQGNSDDLYVPTIISAFQGNLLVEL